MRQSVAITLAALAFVSLSGTVEASQSPGAVDVLTPTSLAIEPGSGWERAVLVVAGPGSYRFRQTYAAAEPIVFDALDPSGAPLPDGSYRYELRLDAAVPAARLPPLRGDLRIEQGVLRLVDRPDSVEVRPSLDSEPASIDAPTHHDSAVTITGTLCVGDNACTAGYSSQDEVEVVGAVPEIRLRDDRPALGSDWTIDGFTTRLAITDNLTFIADIFAVVQGAGAGSLWITSQGVGLGTTTPLAPLHAVGSGGEVGIIEGGTLAVRRTDGGTPNILFTTGNQDWRFQNNPNDGVFSIRDATGTTSSVRVYPGGIGSTLVVRNGRLGLRNTAPQHPIDAFNGARLSSGGVWQNASSREAKQEIEPLSTGEALAALGGLDPVTFAYRADPTDRHVGFIAEDVPELVATPDRRALAAMDVVAVLTRVVQEQERRIAEQERLAERQRAEIAELRELILSSAATVLDP